MSDVVIVGGSRIVYPEFVAELFKKMENPLHEALHACVGIAGEAGELLDACKKVWAYNKPLDRVNALEELGDITFYATALLNQIPPALRRPGYVAITPLDPSNPVSLIRMATRMYRYGSIMLDLAENDLDGEPCANPDHHPETGAVLGPSTTLLGRHASAVMQQVEAAGAALGFTREDIIVANVTKLLKRYPGGKYSDAAAWARADKA